MEVLTHLPVTAGGVKVENTENAAVVDVQWHKGLSHALCDLMVWCIEPFYQQKTAKVKFGIGGESKLAFEFPVNEQNPEFSIQQVKNINDLFIELPKIMRVLGSAISTNILGFTKLVRLLRIELSDLASSQNADPDLRSDFKEMTK